jgi:hypothetical protein
LSIGDLFRQISTSWKETDAVLLGELGSQAVGSILVHPGDLLHPHPPLQHEGVVRPPGSGS